MSHCILNGEKLPTSTTFFFNIVLEVLARTLRHEKERESELEKKSNCHCLQHEMILYVEQSQMPPKND